MSNTSILPPLPDNMLPDMDAKKDGPVSITWLDNGLAVVVADRENIIEHVREQYGLSMFYVVGDRHWKTKWDAGVTRSGQSYQAGEEAHVQPRVFKVVYNAIGYSIHEAADEPSGMFDLEQEAQFTLPAIPYELVQKMEAFFREVHRIHRSEAIVILTFDPTIDGENSTKGWGVAVPDQRNTAGHCNYNQESIVQELPDNAILVGTAHSHPNMSAFASGTDHNDQASFDGIHITFGWQPHINGGLIQHYVEMQMGGKSWELDPKDVFDGMPVPEVDDEVSKWTTKVSKAGDNQNRDGHFGNFSMGRSGGGTDYIAPHLQRSFSRNQEFSLLGEGLLAAHQEWADNNIPVSEYCPDVKEFMVVAELVDENEKNCPVCGTALDSAQIANRRCINCWNFLAQKGEDVCVIAEQRIARRLDFFDLDPNRQTKKPIKIWRRWNIGEVFHTRVDDVEAAVEGQLLPFAMRSDT